MKRPHNSRATAAVAIAAAAALGTTLLLNTVAPSSQKVASQSMAQSAPETKSHKTISGVWTYECEFPVQRPTEIMLTCADGGMIVTDISWETWTTSHATGTGTYSQNMCIPDCAEGTRIDVPVSIKLSEPFWHKGRNVLKTLDIEAIYNGELPSGDKNMTWNTAEFAIRMNWDTQNP